MTTFSCSLSVLPITIRFARSLRSLALTGMHGTTFGGQPLATRIGHHVISRLSSPAFLSNMRSTASHFDELLSRLPEMFPELIPSPIRGRGLMRGIPFAHPQAPGELVKLARHRGVLLLTAGSDAVRLVPSLNVTKEECEHAVGVIESCLGLMQEEGKWGSVGDA
jgi:acetylornithine aminotransferase